MKQIIKILIALFFTIGSFLFGKYSNIENVSNENNDSLNSLQLKVDSLIFENIQLKDTLLVLQNQVIAKSK